ncbi:MAG: type II toxin-antitoxin system VapC family toxin [Candidatus Marinimicrobia bacterium]|nr:type II toxin-antitoxin system VapC family toxin [Candidatus Neomarinimicrobiota bacterium]
MEIKTIVLDTNIYSLSQRADSFSISILEHSNRIIICPIVLGELLAGFKYGSKEQENLNTLNKFLDSPRVEIVDVTEATANHYSQIYSDLREAGTPIPANDMWIAAIAKENGVPLATADNHFTKVPGLLLIQPN